MTFPCYPDYRGSGVAWLGNVPAHWNLSKIKYDSYVKARVGWHGLKSDEFTDEGPYLVTGSDFKNRTVDWGNCYHCTIERFEQDQYIQLKEGDLLITKDGTIGKLILVEGLPDKATLNSGIFVVRPLEERYSTQFYFWLLQSCVFYDFIGINKTGSTILHLYQETFENLPYALPPIGEQRVIAAFLDHETARIDALIAEQQRLIELLKEKRQAVISHAVTKGLAPNVPMKDSGVEWLGEVPAHWSLMSAKRFFRLVADPAPKNNDYELLSVYTDIGVRPRKELEQKGNKASTTDGYWLVRKGDLIVNKLLAWMGAIGYSAYDGVTSPAYDILRPTRGLEPKYFHYLFRDKTTQQEFKRWSRGIMEMRLRLYFDELGRITMPFPPRAEQAKIVHAIEKIENQYDNLINAATEQIALLQERRSALVSAAITGKIDVRTWRPPADKSAFDPEVRTAGLEAVS